MSTTTLNPAPGETSLATLLSTLKTRLHPETFVFLTLAKGEAPPASLFIQMLFREVSLYCRSLLDRSDILFLKIIGTGSLGLTLHSVCQAEGLTVITTQESAEAHKLEYIFPSKMITLDIHSSLEAVGFMAAVSAKLTESGIGVNPVSGFL